MGHLRAVESGREPGRALVPDDRMEPVREAVEHYLETTRLELAHDDRPAFAAQGERVLSALDQLGALATPRPA